MRNKDGKMRECS